jgi:uncharacterized protein
MSRRVDGGYYVYRLLPPRPTFHLDMNDREREVMNQHASYWQAKIDAGDVVVYGPVLVADASWGLAVFAAANEDDARTIIESDPAIASGMATYELGAMAATVLPD